MGRVLTTAVGLVTVMSAFGCGSSSTLTEASGGRAGAATAVISAPGAPDVVDVVCTATGTNVSATTVAAQPDGVHVRVTDTSGASGVYLNYRYASGGGGDGVGKGTSVRVLGIAPGSAQFACSSDLGREKDEPIAIEVRDPANAWRTGALDAIGCIDPANSNVAWVFEEGKGQTPDAALTGLVAQMEKPTTWQAVQEGYAAATRQTYVLRRAGKPWISAFTVHNPDGSYAASAGAPCDHPDWDKLRGSHPSR